jgi:hypothetical protein
MTEVAGGITVGGMAVVVGSAATPVVEVGMTATWVLVTGGLPLAGNLHAEAASASSTSNNPMKTIFLFMLFSLASFSVYPMALPNDDILHHFMNHLRWFQYELGCN